MMSHSTQSDRGLGGADPIVEAAMEVLAELGPTRMTMAEVARRAGVSRMTVYRRYRSLDALVSAVLTAEIADVLTEIAARSRPAGSARDRVVAQSAAMVEALIDHTLLQRVLAVDPQSLLPLLVERIGSGQRMLRDYVAEALRAGMASQGGDGSVRDGDPRLLALTVVTIAQPFVVGSKPLRTQYPPDALLQEFASAIDAYLTPTTR